MADGRIYMLQPSFAAGEISPDVASRVDLDKYQSALLQAENVFIRPYGSAYRRPGTEHVDNIASGNVRLQEFTLDASTSYLLVFTSGKVYIYKSGTLITSKNTPFTGTELSKLRFAQSADVMFIASGSHPVQILKRTGTDTFSNLSDFAPSPGYFDATTMTDGVTITPSARSGSVTLTASSGVFSSGQVGNQIMLRQNVSADTVSRSSSGTSGSLLAGPAGWKVISHGTWKGSFTIEYSDDNDTWLTLRSYSSDDDFNVTESGTFDEQTYIRLNVNLTSGTFTADLTRFPYTYEGWANITAYTDSTHVTATVKKRFINTSASNDWSFGSWSGAYGYPSCVTFFQDRLCFAANNRQPYMVWMSRTGDYYNFGTERVNGTVTDDSAVAISFISRKDYRILHMLAHADLIIMTEGNEWIINGAETVTPTNVSPRVQTSRGCTDVVPEMIGGQTIYVQRHGKTVRDMQYNFGTDSYDGMDLTILAKHITQDTYIVDSAYRQEPDYMVFFVLNDGTAACLTYVNEQRVYAWCRMVTNGTIRAVETISTPLYDDVYFVVKRGSTNYLERLSEYPHDDNPHSYVLLDCAAHANNVTATDTITAAWLANKTVDVLADGRYIADLKANGSGTVTLPVKCKNWVMGIPYRSIWELPNIEMMLRDGTLQGRRKKVAEVILRLERSLGGRVGINMSHTDVIKYKELEAAVVPAGLNPPIPPPSQEVKLYSGEKIVTVPNITEGGVNDKGRVVVTSKEPYPLSISSIVRAVVPNG